MGDGSKPAWFRVRFSGNTSAIGELLSGHGLNSVCQSAHCPNRMECWSSGTASFMVMGEECTRACRFCAIRSNPKPPPLDANEPGNLADAVSKLGLRYVVITSVTRDDLDDGGSMHFAECVRAVKSKNPAIIVEALVPDFLANPHAIKTMIGSRADVISHNIETVERLTPLVRDRRAGYRQSLEALGLYRERSDGTIITKSGIMLGFGERENEVIRAMEDLRDVGVEILTIGQYLSPGKEGRFLPVSEYVTPETFARYEKTAYSLGFKYVASGPLVRSSYKAAEPFIKGILASRLG